MLLFLLPVWESVFNSSWALLASMDENNRMCVLWVFISNVDLLKRGSKISM
jgi:hypothetical protein